MRFVVFVLTLFAAASSWGADVERYQILKGRHYFQVGTTGPKLQTNNAYRFTSSINLSTNGQITGASLIPPHGAGQPYLADRDGNPWRIRENFDEAQEIERFFPNGGYLMSIQTAHDGPRTLAHSILGSVYPAAPVLANYQAMQNIPYNYYSEIFWQPFAGGTTNDFIQVQIENLNDETIFETPDFGQTGALNGLATRALLEPGDLESGVTYFGTIRFIRVLQNGGAAYPGVPGAVGYFTRTEFTVRCVPTTISPAVQRIELWQSEDLSQRANESPFITGRDFRAKLDATTELALTNVTLISPPNRTNQLIGQLGEFDFQASFATLAEMQNAYRAGDYIIDAVRPSGVAERFTLPFATNQFPPMPFFRDLPTSLVNSEQDLVIKWDRWTNASELDFVRVELLDEAGLEIFQTPGFTSSRRLTRNDTSMVIPSTLLLPNRRYYVDLTFRKVTSMETRTIPGGLGLTGYARRTRFTFQTSAADVSAFGVSLSRSFWQRGENLFTSDPAPYVFEAFANEFGSNYILNAALALPTNSVLTLPRETNGLGFKLTVQEDPSQALTRFPTGIYTFRFETLHDGFKTSTVTVATKDFPPIPKVRNFSTLPTVPFGSGSYGLTWDPWVGARVGQDVVRIIIRNAVGQVLRDTGPLGSITAQAGTNIAYGITGLTRERSYTVTLRFETMQQFPSAAYQGTTGRFTIFSETHFYMSTLTRNATLGFPFSSRSPLLTNGNLLQYEILPALANRLYRVEATMDFLGWTAVQTNLAPIDGTPFLISVPTSLERAVLRTSLLP